MSSKINIGLRIATEACYTFGVLCLTLVLLLSMVNFQVAAEDWNKASLVFNGDCGGNCTKIKALIM